MLKTIKTTTKRIGWDYISECEVVDTETNEKYYVVAQLGNLLYATFESSWLAFRMGKTKEEPVKIEGEKYWFCDCDENGNRSKFYDFYEEALKEANSLEHKQYITRKYTNIKKPVGNIDYEVIYREDKPVFACGPIGGVYEIKFHILDNDSYLYVYSDDAVGASMVIDFSVFEKEEAGEEVFVDNPIDYIESFKQAKKSVYYDLYLEMEKFKDNY